MIRFKKIIAFLSLLFLMSNSMTSFAVGPVEPVGPQTSVGVQGETGTVGQVGSTLNDNTNESPPAPTTQTTDAATQVDSQTKTETENLPPPVVVEQTTTPSVTTIDTKNNTTITNDADINLNSGNNTINDSTKVGSIGTGEIDGAACVINLGDVVLSDDSSIGLTTIDGSKAGNILLTPSNDRILLNNSATGPNSENQNIVKDNNIVNILQGNNTTMNTTIDLNANTGGNKIGNHTVVGDIVTGDVNLAANVIDFSNLQGDDLILSIDSWSILGNYTGDIIIPNMNNENTGPNSLNSNQLGVSQDTDISVESNYNLADNFIIDTSTGENEIGNNSAIGNIKTGETTVNGSSTTVNDLSNVPVFYLFNVFGEWNGEIVGLNPSMYVVNEINNTTGPNSNNINDIANNNDTNIDINNNTNIINNINISANTGKNNISNNTSVNNIETGSINIIANSLKALGCEAGKFSVKIINIFGDWTGSARNQEIPIIQKPAIVESIKKISTDAVTKKSTNLSSEGSPVNNQNSVPLSSDYLQSHQEKYSNYQDQGSDDNNNNTVASKENSALNSQTTKGQSQLAYAANTGKDNSSNKSDSSKPNLLLFGGLSVIIGWIIIEIISKKILIKKI
jgi:hypothetical protein